MLRVESFPFNDYDNPLRVPVSMILRDELYKDTDRSQDLRTYRHEMAETDELHTFALLRGELVVATASVRIDTIKEPVSRIRNVAVANKWRGKGYGGIILSASEDYIVENQETQGLKLSQVQPTRVSIPFYRRMGYEFVSPDSDFMAKVIS